MYKWIYSVVFFGAGIFFLVAMSSLLADRAKASQPEDTGGLPVVKFVVQNFSFDQPEYKVKSGEKVRLEVEMKEGVHEVAIPEFNVDLSKANPKKDLSFDKPGTYVVKCVLPCGSGHANMNAKFIVE